MALAAIDWWAPRNAYALGVALGFILGVLVTGAFWSHSIAQAMSAGTAKTPKAVEGQRPASAVAESHAPNPDSQP